MGLYSKFRGVTCHRDPRTGKRTAWMMATSIEGRKVYKHCKTERAAAIAYDRLMIREGKEPVNILKRKL